MPWILTVSHETPLFTRMAIFQGLRDCGLENIGFRYDALKYVEGKVYVDLHTHAQYLSFLHDAIAQDDLFLAQQLDKIYAEGRSLIDRTRVLVSRDLAAASRRELAGLFEAFLSAFRSMTAYLIAPLGAASVLEKTLEAAVGGQSDPGELFEDYMLALTAPGRLTRFGHFHQATLDLAVEAADDPKLRALLEEDVPIVELERRLHTNAPDVYESVRDIVARFGWLNMEYCFGEPFSFEDILERLRWFARSRPERKARELLEQRRSLQQRFAQVVSTLDLSARDLSLAQLEQEYAYVRHWRYEDLSLAGVSARPLFEAVANRLALGYKDLAYLTPDECLEMLVAGEVADADVLALAAERRHGYAAEMLDGAVTVASGSAIAAYREAVEVTADVRELVGVVASPGFATGKARIVHGRADFQKVQAGDILVVTMTTPDYVPVMDRSAAIVADAGGRTSHTAIVSRELGIPCVIGTKVATSVLQDGEVVEVDARRGRVIRVAVK